MNDAVFKRDLAHSGINETLAIITEPPIGVFASVVGRGISFGCHRLRIHVVSVNCRSKLPFCSFYISVFVRCIFGLLFFLHTTCPFTAFPCFALLVMPGLSRRRGIQSVFEDAAHRVRCLEALSDGVDTLAEGHGYWDIYIQCGDFAVSHRSTPTD